MFSAALYARGRTFVHTCSRDLGCSAHPAFPAPSELEEGEMICKTSGVMRRENAMVRLSPTAVIARLDRAAQYSRNADD